MIPVKTPYTLSRKGNANEGNINNKDDTVRQNTRSLNPSRTERNEGQSNERKRGGWGGEEGRGEGRKKGRERGGEEGGRELQREGGEEGGRELEREGGRKER